MNPDFSLSLHATQQQEIRNLDCKATWGVLRAPAYWTAWRRREDGVQLILDGQWPEEGMLMPLTHPARSGDAGIRRWQCP